ncbi:hypothetical protein [Neptuniibacter sp. QD37_11]|uniref:hypothetical protein n=1 Tax=Neptuniibacter sp. QD37_11 TaxID=3398209 RepID=UPI0039F52CE5
MCKRCEENYLRYNQRWSSLSQVKWAIFTDFVPNNRRRMTNTRMSRDEYFSKTYNLFRGLERAGLSQQDNTILDLKRVR